MVTQYALTNCNTTTALVKKSLQTIKYITVMEVVTHSDVNETFSLVEYPCLHRRFVLSIWCLMQDV